MAHRRTTSPTPPLVRIRASPPTPPVRAGVLSTASDASDTTSTSRCAEHGHAASDIPSAPSCRTHNRSSRALYTLTPIRRASLSSYLPSTDAVLQLCVRVCVGVCAAPVAEEYARQVRSPTVGGGHVRLRLVNAARAPRPSPSPRQPPPPWRRLRLALRGYSLPPSSGRLPPPLVLPPAPLVRLPPSSFPSSPRNLRVPLHLLYAAHTSLHPFPATLHPRRCTLSIQTPVLRCGAVP
ncbi:hypothetical protein C8R47DRAFT_184834 [Mycena vitilis]|nr:hypothetical protein C8R47DRAFT_184834 [Mycena vitilis]